MKHKIPLIISIGGCIFFGLSNIYILNRANTSLDNILRLNITMAFTSYKKGCLDNTQKKDVCSKKALIHIKEIQEIYIKMDNM